MRMRPRAPPRGAASPILSPSTRPETLPEVPNPYSAQVPERVPSVSTTELARLSLKLSVAHFRLSSTALPPT